MRDKDLTLGGDRHGTLGGPRRRQGGRQLREHAGAGNLRRRKPAPGIRPRLNSHDHRGPPGRGAVSEQHGGHGWTTASISTTGKHPPRPTGPAEGQPLPAPRDHALPSFLCICSLGKSSLAGAVRAHHAGEPSLPGSHLCDSPRPRGIATSEPTLQSCTCQTVPGQQQVTANDSDGQPSRSLRPPTTGFA